MLTAKHDLVKVSMVFISTGITTYFDEPDFSDTSTSIEGATPIGDPSTSNTVETQSQTSIEFSWENPSPSQVEAIYCGVGSTENDNDIFPETMVSNSFPLL